MNIWEEKLNIKPPAACNRTAICCQVVTSVEPWKKLAVAKANQSLKDFFNIFIPYQSHGFVINNFPDAYDACMKIVKGRQGVSFDHLYFYYCRFLTRPNICNIYEDRPTLCRNYPESPFDAISKECGYYKWSLECKKAYINMQQELTKLHFCQFSSFSFFIMSPSYSWII